MNERGMSTAEKRTPLKRKIARVAAAATGLLFGLGLATNTSAQPVETGTISGVAVPHTPTSPQNICKSLPESYIAGRADRLQQDLRNRQLGGSSRTWNKENIAKAFGVKLVDSDATIAKIDTTKDIRKKLQIANTFTTKVHGFTLMSDSLSDPDQLSIDLKSVIGQLDDTPPALSRALKINVVTLMSKKADDAKVEGKEVAGLANMSWTEPNNIWIAPNGAGSFKHEYSHHVQAVYQERVCATLYNYEDAEYSSNNPSYFVYRDTSKLPTAAWEGTTVEEYGAKNVHEDEATVGEALTEHDINSYLSVRRNETIARKMAIVALHMDTLARGTGNYFLNNYIEHTPVATVEPGWPN